MQIALSTLTMYDCGASDDTPSGDDPVEAFALLDRVTIT